MRLMMAIGLIVLVSFCFCSCATVDHSVRIDTDNTDGYATGYYKDDRFGQLGSWGFWFLGGYGGDTVSCWPWRDRQGYSDPVQFAKAITMINYSKKLKRIEYDRYGEIVGYEFDTKPSRVIKRYQQMPSQQSLPPSFGYEPIE
ncbi:MAG: hypothetical protein ACLFUU_05415 [Desulfobacteraceae bacterium]